MVMVFGFGASPLFQQFYQSAFALYFAVNLLFIVIANILRFLNKNKLAIFYAAANIPVITGTIIYYSNYYNLSNLWFGWVNPVAPGLSIETFLISFGFAYRYNFIINIFPFPDRHAIMLWLTTPNKGRNDNT